MPTSITRHIAAAAAILAVAAYSLAAEEDGDFRYALVKLQVAVLQLADRADATRDFYDPSAVQGLRDQVRLLQRLAVNGVESGAAEIYAKALGYDAQVINRAARSKDSAEARRLVAEAVADLTLKTDFSNGALNATPILKGRVLVKVRTETADGVELRGLLIRLNPLGINSSDPLFFFNNPTPTEQVFLPGR